MTDMTAEQALDAVHDLIGDSDGIADSMDLMYKLEQVESFLAGVVQSNSALTAPRVPEWRSAKDGQHFPKIGAHYLVRYKGSFLSEVFQFDQTDDGMGGGEYFWSNDLMEICPTFSWEHDEWLAISTLTAAQSPADVTLTNEGDIGQVADSESLGEALKRYTRDEVRWSGDCTPTKSQAARNSELARLREALDKIQAIADGYVSEGELPVMVVVQTICKKALLKGADQ